MIEKIRLGIAIVMHSVPINLENKFIIPYSGFPMFILLGIYRLGLHTETDFPKRDLMAGLVVYVLVSHLLLLFLIRKSNRNIDRKYNGLKNINMSKFKAWCLYIVSWVIYNIIIVGVSVWAKLVSIPS